MIKGMSAGEALREAASRFNPQLLRQALARGADAGSRFSLSYHDPRDYGFLDLAARDGRSGATPEAQRECLLVWIQAGLRPSADTMKLAARSGNDTALAFFWDQGLAPAKTSPTELMMCAMLSGQAACAHFLTTRGADPFTSDQAGEPTVMEAARHLQEAGLASPQTIALLDALDLARVVGEPPAGKTPPLRI